MAETVAYARIRQKNRITLPKKIMDLFDLKENDDVVFIIESNKVTLGKIKKEIIEKIET